MYVSTKPSPNNYPVLIKLTDIDGKEKSNIVYVPSDVVCELHVDLREQKVARHYAADEDVLDDDELEKLLEDAELFFNTVETLGVSDEVATKVIDLMKMQDVMEVS